MYPRLTPFSNVGMMLELKVVSRRNYSSINIEEEGEGERRAEGRKGEEREERIGRECDKERRGRKGKREREERMRWRRGENGREGMF